MSGYTSAGLSNTQVVLSQDADVPIRDSVNENTLATGIAQIAAHVLEGIELSANNAIIQNGVGNFDVQDFGAGGGMVAVIARVTTNQPGVQLANATTKIAIDAAPVTIRDAANKTAAATIAVDQGNWQNFPLTNATDALVSDGLAIQIENQGGTQGVGGTVAVAAGVAEAKLPASAAMVADSVGIAVPVTGTYVDTITPQVTAAGVITGFVLS